jgi:hypothetical protein
VRFPNIKLTSSTCLRGRENFLGGQVRESLRYITIAIFELSLMAVIPEQHEGSSADRDREEGLV